LSRNRIFSSPKCRKWTLCNTFKLVHKLIFSLLDMLINVNWGGTRVLLLEQSEFSMPGILCLANPTKRSTHFSCFLMFICYVVMTIKWLHCSIMLNPNINYQVLEYIHIKLGTLFKGSVCANHPFIFEHLIYDVAWFVCIYLATQNIRNVENAQVHRASYII
jgi:hypothetical protein